MAFEDDLRGFLENRLREFDPSIDLSTGSPAQLQVIDPTIARFGEDPFSVKTRDFVIARLTQEFPELAASAGGELEDLFVSPMQVLIEPFKRAVESVRINLSVENADLMADDEADALAANFFETREEGGFAGGQVRLFFTAPTTVQITTDRQCTSKAGVAFFPTSNTFITSQQMVFNRDGSQYFVDITVKADEAGDEGNVIANDIITIDDVEGVIRVANLTDFLNGSPREDNEEFLGGIDQALTERSLVTDRGISTRVPDVFGSQVRALQTIGASEEGMDRDILSGTSEGFLHLIGNVSFFQSWIIIGSVGYKDDGPDNDVTIQPGDTVRLILDLTDDPDRTAHEASITDIISTGVGTSLEKHILILDSTFDTVIGSSGTGATVAVFKKGFITISGLPGGLSANLTVEEGEVHLGGHMDIMIRPAADARREGVLPNLTDSNPLLALLDVATVLGDNLVSSATSFVAAGAESGNLLVIEEGSAAGSYKILSVGSPDAATELRVDTLFTSSEAGLRARLVQSITVDLVEPKVPKVPFTAGPVSDLQTTVGTALFRLGTDIQSFGGAVGDTIRVLDGLNAGDYIIQDFDSVLGGKGPIVDRAAASTGANQRYEVFTSSDGLEFPLVRIETLEVLDSTNQGTGIAVPYGDTVDVRATCDFEGAGKSIRVLDKQLIIAPDGLALWGVDGSGLANDFIITPSATTDARYSKEISIADGRVRISGSGFAPINEAEFNIPPFAYNGRRDTLLALTTREDPEFAGTTGNEHRTSDIAEGKVGDSLVILDGPNAGNYVIRDLRILDVWGIVTSGHRKIAIIQVDEELPVDPLSTIIDYIAETSGTTGVSVITATELAGFYEEANRYFNSLGWLEQIIIPRLESTLNHASQGFTFTTQEVRDLVLDLHTTGYDVGASAEGTLRLFFQEPVSAEFYFGESDPTLFQVVGNDALRYRLSPNLSPAQIFPESEEDTLPTTWNRNLSLQDSPNSDIAYLIGGSSFAQRGIQAGDVMEFHRAINDMKARGLMESGWLVATQAGSNQVRFIIPKGGGEGLDNGILPEPGHLFFIDSGPDIGAYVITEVTAGNSIVSDPPLVEFRIDKSLTHTTDVYPPDFAVGVPSKDLDHDFFAMAVLETIGNVFPMTLPPSAQLKLEQGASSGTVEHTFLLTSYANIGEIVTELTDIGAGTAWGTAVSAVVAKFDIFADGDELVIRTNITNQFRDISIEDATTTEAAASGQLEYRPGQADGAHRAAVCLPGTKRLNGDAFTAPNWEANQWVSIHAIIGNHVSVPVVDGEDPVVVGVDEAYLGTYKIISVGITSGGPRDSEPFIELDRSADFPLTMSIRWIRHSAPTTNPSNTSDGGKELSSIFVRGRMYVEVPESETISVPWGATPASPLEGVDDVAVDPTQLLLSNDPTDGFAGFSHKMPYRITRAGVKSVSSTAMSQNRAGALYYVDLPVVGLGVIEDLNISVAAGLTLEGRSRIEGYTLAVGNEIFTFSVEEQVSIILPSSVLPVGSTPDADNKIALTGQNLQVNYDSAPLIADIQAFFDSKLDRVVVASALVRHFLPSYVFLDAIYVGGDVESDVAADLISFINNIDPNINELRSDDITQVIRRRNAIQVQQPINLIALTHGIDRRIRGTQSEDFIGGTNLPTFQGNFKQTYFISGPDSSTDDVRPNGEQVFLTRL